MIAWKFRNTNERQSLDDPVGCDVVYYAPDSKEIQTRLIGDFMEALKILDARYRDVAMPADGARILKLK